jgi:hypothetical protein
LVATVSEIIGESSDLATPGKLESKHPASTPVIKVDNDATARK